jgi:hypothetical protein
MDTQDMKKAIANMIEGDLHIIKSTSTEYEYHFVPKGCKCGGTSGLGYGLPSYDIAVWEAYKHAKQIQEQGWHSHGGSKKHKNKVAA